MPEPLQENPILNVSVFSFRLLHLGGRSSGVSLEPSDWLPPRISWRGVEHTVPLALTQAHQQSGAYRIFASPTHI
jgi:hypothetical protein